jgi:ferredoxin
VSRLRTARPSERLRVDPVACEGVGMCAHVAARLVRLDSWGYPVVPQEPLYGGDRRRAAAAVSACPQRALFLEAQPSGQ